MRSTVFQRVRWGAGLAGLLSCVAIVQYPGGTRVDHSAAGYSLARNFLSDLGMTVAYGGKTNTLSALLFTAALATVVLGLGATLVGFARLHSRAAVPRWLAASAGAAGLVVCAALIGVALTPENRALSLHIQLTGLAFRVFPAVPLLLATASLHDSNVPRRLAFVWASFAIVLLSYLCLIGWGPPIETPTGLVVQVIAQKVVAITAVAIVVYQGWEAERILVANLERRDSDRSATSPVRDAPSLYRPD